ncbi:bifunctional heptose 7-phosphate kinase/heptose 1-phosphate adenyltransferase [Dactylosporangium roseum]|uniref:Bifunctional heptose 7-phosphate kinase/heptose 1-phosphate adenyltransferase n=1 Tax=Dactylosporangium roseum TaxID=47989 RepID=A0ABY5YXU2_9ACTN|nr:PfkB family carbohydrate kinase [Dactylosporangium roseum]UWZ34057.1 bifunctional heptose 7-phosphate kinase/heptose 1-phosphate adenyltransferase [Dactylosporangium roseum]
MRLVVVGDTVLDRDVDGSVHRVSPDAPALVLDEESAVDRPGGAGLAALLAARCGFPVALVTAIADDARGARLAELLTAAGVELHPVPLPGATPEKIRLRARGQVLLRLDRGGGTRPPGDVPDTALALFDAPAAVLVSDYGRGMTGHPRLREALAATPAPIVWDPHPRGAAPVPGVRLVTPNEGEVRTLSGDAGGGARVAAATRAGNTLRRQWRAGAVAVTMGGRGAVLCHAGPTPLVVPAPSVAGGDSCGAGDRFAASAAIALARGALPSEAVQSAVAEATEYVIAGGVTAARTDRTSGAPGASTTAGAAGVDTAVGVDAAARVVAEVRAGNGTIVATGGCFDLLHAGHVATLQAARRLGDCLVVCLNSDGSVRGLKGADRPLVPQTDRARLLAALGCVDAVVVFDEPTPEATLAWLRPDLWVKGGDYADGGPDLPEAELVRRWGGQTVVVPYLDGRSTSGMISAARGASHSTGGTA